MRFSLLLNIVFTGFFVFSAGYADGAVFKIATLTPEGSFWMQKMREGAREVALKTDNRVRFKFYPGGVMGNDKTVLRKIQVGQLQGGAVMAGGLDKFSPDIEIYGLPMLFKSFDEADYVRKRIDPVIMDGLKKGGFVSFGLAGAGFAYIMSSVPIHTVEDLSRQKVWAPDDDPVFLLVVKNFGVTPIPLSLADVRTGLQTGLINTVATSPVGAIALQWHTQVKYVLEIPMSYLYGTLGVTKKSFEKISAEDQKITGEVIGGIMREIDQQNRKDNLNAMETLRKQGIRFISPTSEAMKEWNKRAEQSTGDLLKNRKFSNGIIIDLEKNLNDYRHTIDGNHK